MVAEIKAGSRTRMKVKWLAIVVEAGGIGKL